MMSSAKTFSRASLRLLGVVVSRGNPDASGTDGTCCQSTSMWDCRGSPDERIETLTFSSFTPAQVAVETARDQKLPKQVL